MANTVIQLKRSTSTATPTSLNIAEPAYSYQSNTFFIGSPDGDGVLQIGGYTRDQLLTYSAKHANLAFDKANSEVATGASSYANSAFLHANSSHLHANSAHDHANAGFDAANTNAGNITTADAKATSAGSYANSAFLHANAAFDAANTNASDIASNDLTSGGVISGALTVTQNVTVIGNLTVEGTQTAVDSTNILIADNILTLNSAIDQASAPVKDAGIEIDRGSSDNVVFKFSETADHWQFTNDGTNYENVASEAAESYANSAFAVANTASASGTSSGSYANAAFLHANSAHIHANAGFDAANTNAGNITTADAKATSAGSYANSAFLHANAAFTVANTDVTEISITGIHVGEADKVAAFEVAANGRIVSANSTSIALAASAITSGTLGVARGGTGVGSLTNNGVVLGQGTSALTTASSSTEGHLLTINSSGVPTFGHLSGGDF